MTAQAPDLATSVRAAFDYALLDDRANMIEHLADIAGWGVRGVHTACWGWAAACLYGMTGNAKPDPDGGYYLEVTNAVTGKRGSLDDAEEHPARKAAVQMITLYGNQDLETSVAIVETMIASDGTGADLLMAMVTLAAEVAKAHLQQHAQDCDGCPDHGGGA